uniref:Uncharacterized protein n=1 Tax=Calcidiscus leptoporus TaxID=127549 RepID=A0A7S0JKK3_9EUKA|mmetsp:Transcript_9194/g.21332  ORF Transcript_9194/g.21332 Transcript_9194/m.21332 type:complete len:295 (+) Transcript_9194:76-960(+)|eukprot:CAMPEP_0119380002 /NCGR_PEP_ID=MMETSP1334-20130426/55064_1 /TAXON_ID=127549 /ORGANISM="Calcidiscus leptoporus, Strain RCC1130" /LENGTH=294 /DNA_ID=CAMNT_0007399673 /DNA_START=72 /DNA_END=956 /DNA_ORIENTATION=+
MAWAVAAAVFCAHLGLLGRSPRTRYQDFEVLKREIRSYLTTLDPGILNNPAAPSPLSYVELQRNGRTDLVEGCMLHGGYLKVSDALRVRVSLAPPKEIGTTPGFLKEEGEVGLVLSASALEARLSEPVTAPAVSVPAKSAPTTGTMPRDKLMPLKTTSSDAVGPAAEGVAARAPRRNGALALRFDGLQRASMLLLLVLVSLGFGKASSEVADASTLGVVQLAATALLIGHFSMGFYGALLVAKGGKAAELKSGALALGDPAQQASTGPPAFWLFKVALTGVGGLQEVRKLIEEL